MISWYNVVLVKNLFGHNFTNSAKTAFHSGFVFRGITIYYVLSSSVYAGERITIFFVLCDLILKLKNADRTNYPISVLVVRLNEESMVKMCRNLFQVFNDRQMLRTYPFTLPASNTILRSAKLLC